MTTIPPSAKPNIAISEERVKELRKRASNYGSLPESTVNDILDDYSALKGEVKRLNAWHSTLSEAWKARAEKAEAELAKHAPLMTSKEEQALNQIAEEPHTHPECPTTDEEWEAERNCRHCQAVEALDHAWEEIRNTAHRLDRAALALKMEKK